MAYDAKHTLHVAELKKKSSNVAYALQVKPPALVLVTIQNKNTATPSLNKVHKSVENKNMCPPSRKLLQGIMK